ncbi:bifunctional methylenetetrahydrofolate dehydrogenase/methenyltetrahydrofolate cyclohydrolase FolD [uncultured Tyzzerella sp.]|uniref:bifunctional methylenetetrahydrofolate dehydrogenase/methenyltetrahydrofolate cyclohydrolase FolD n=1 Tax=uncultured Tyzzerella sp. TaxID=2321398 RepID=UPI00294336BD|nr:bifunctional methylenetetrahydrofolate dehydrogenase/methenyltetrahydrofolate cyclohydrolase FolD [uncultured Tyzzerella sp.]
MSNIINGTEIAKIIKDEIKKDIENLQGKKPCLAVIILGNDDASHIYVNNKNKACDYVGIKTDTYFLDDSISEVELLSLIEELNDDTSVNGILVQLPLPKHINEKNILFKINPLKDVDGFHPYNIGLLSTNSATLKSCTPSGCMEILKRYNVEIKGKNALVIGRSNIVGKPISMMLLNEDATVTTAHTKTKDLEYLTKQADIIIVAIGVANFLKPHMVKEGVILIDVGINRFDGKLCGDIDFSCSNKASLITPVPGGVGPMTITMLMKNCLIAYKIQNNINIEEN